MEKAVCPVRYSFVAVNTTRTNDADRGLGVLHRSCLYRRGVCTKKNIGRSSAKFNAENTCQSSSISGPSAIENPKRAKISHISFFTKESGCLDPNGMG